MKKKIIPLVLAASLGCGLLSGCQSSELRSYKADQTMQTSASSGATDYTACYETYDADKVMLTINGIDITWGELFYWYVYDVSNLEQNVGAITDWKAKCAADETKTNAQYVMDNALDTIKQYCVVESQAKEKGVTLSDADKKTIDESWQKGVQNYGNGDEATFVAYLKKAYLTKKMYYHINQLNALYNQMIGTMYGANGEKLSQDQILEEAKKLNYVRAKNLLISTQDESGNALTDAKKAEKKALADKLHAELKGITNQAALIKRFDELIAQYGGDPGTQYYPDGYTFMTGQGTMDENFEKAVTALSDGQVSDVVETNYGYHIALRLPLSADAVVEIESDNSTKKLGYFVAQQLFNNDVKTWSESAKVEYSKTYKKLNLAKIFSKAKAAVTETASPSPSASSAASGAAATPEAAHKAETPPAATAKVSASPAA